MFLTQLMTNSVFVGRISDSFLTQLLITIERNYNSIYWLLKFIFCEWIIYVTKFELELRKFQI